MIFWNTHCFKTLFLNFGSARFLSQMNHSRGDATQLPVLIQNQGKVPSVFVPALRAAIACHASPWMVTRHFRIPRRTCANQLCPSWTKTHHDQRWTNREDTAQVKLPTPTSQLGKNPEYHKIMAMWSSK